MREIKHLKTPTSFLDVVSYDDYQRNKNIYGNPNTAIEMTDGKGNVYALPYKKKGSTGPGLYDHDWYSVQVFPGPDDHRYDESNVINLSNSRDMDEFMEKNQMIKDMEADILTNPDNIYAPTIGENDTEEMKGLKEAIISKKIDIDKYEPRFGPNFPNEKRLLRGEKISIDKLKRICNLLDIGVEIKFYDKLEDVPNPMRKTITKVITDGGIEE